MTDLPTDPLDELLRDLEPQIVTLGHPTLRVRSTPVGDGHRDRRIAALIDVMIHMMRSAGGVGLAAPQLGVPLRVIVLEDRAEVASEVVARAGRVRLPMFAAIDPEYEVHTEDLATFYEGCLSFPGWRAAVPRHLEITLRYRTVDGGTVERTLTGWPARIAQHEIDHLDGTVYVDRADLRSLSSLAEYTRRFTPLSN